MSWQLVNCGLSSPTLSALEKKGITALFPIQKHVFEPAMAGKDLICRAKTGSGKTLAFAIPVIESLIKVPFLICTDSSTHTHLLPWFFMVVQVVQLLRNL